MKRELEVDYNEWAPNAKRGFRYLEIRKDEHCIINAEQHTYNIVFFLTGEVVVSCREEADVHFYGGQMTLYSLKNSCQWKAILDTTCLVLLLDDDLLPCNRKVIKEHADWWLEVVPSTQPLSIKPILMNFLDSVKTYLADGFSCSFMHTMKRQELSLIFRGYYTQDEITPFSLPMVCDTHEFKTFVMNNYLEMKGLKEFVDLSGMNLSQFNRKFKAHFKESPYQWLIKQRSEHIYQELSLTNKSFAVIAKKFHFSDASHFNRYCKSIYGVSPTKIRENALLAGKCSDD